MLLLAQSRMSLLASITNFSFYSSVLYLTIILPSLHQHTNQMKKESEKLDWQHAVQELNASTVASLDSGAAPKSATDKAKGR
jgi:hypothetical protein